MEQKWSSQTALIDLDAH